MRARERWLRYRSRPCEREALVGEVAQIAWPLILKAARASIVDGRLRLVPGGDPVAGLLKHIGGRPQREGRYFALALQELRAAGLVRLEADAIVVNDWAQYKPSAEKKNAGFFWLKLWSSESGSFSALPPMCRGFAHVLMRIADEDGYLPASSERILDRLGWQTYHREVPNPDGGKALRVRRYLCERGHVEQWLQLLFEDGYLERDPSKPRTIRIRNYTRFQPPVRRLPDHVENTLTSRSSHAENTPESRWHHDEKAPKSADSFTSRVNDLNGLDQNREDPPYPPADSTQTGGGSFSKTRKAERSHEAPDAEPAEPPNLPADRPDWYRRIFTAYPNHDDELAAWAAAQKAAPRVGGGEVLAAMTLEALTWQPSLTRWRKAGGQFIPKLANYFAAGAYANVRPTDPALFAAPVETAEERKARRDAAAKAAAKAQVNEPPPEERVPPEERARSIWQARPLEAVYRAPSLAVVRAVAEGVLADRLAAFRAENPVADLPPLLATFAQSCPQLAAPPPVVEYAKDAESAEKAGEKATAGLAPEWGQVLPMEKFLAGLRAGLGVGTDRASLIAQLRAGLRKCDELDERIKALE